MADWLANLTAFRDVLLLFINLGALACLIAVVTLLVLHFRQTRIDRARQLSLLQQLLDRPTPATPQPLGDFKSPRVAPLPAPAIPPAETLAPLKDLLKQHAEALQNLTTTLARELPQPTTDDFHQLLVQQQDALRQLLADWRKEGDRRLQANEELRSLLREDIRSQADRFKRLLEASPPAAAAPIATPTPTSGTITASAADAPDPDNQAWREEVRAELRRIVDRLERMSERMEEIFQI